MDHLEVDKRDDRYLLRLRVKPNARQDGLGGVHGGALKLQVKDPPEKGKANKGVSRVLARALDLSPREVELVSGHTSQDKRVAIRFGGPEEELRRKLFETWHRNQPSAAKLAGDTPRIWGLARVTRDSPERRSDGEET